MDLLLLTVVTLISFVLSLALIITVYIDIQHRKYAHIPGPQRKGIKE